MENSVITVNGESYSFKIICGKDKMFIIEGSSDFGSVTSPIINDSYLREFKIVGSALKNKGQTNLTFTEYNEVLTQFLIQNFEYEEVKKIIHLYCNLINESKFNFNRLQNESNF